MSNIVSGYIPTGDIQDGNVIHLQNSQLLAVSDPEFNRIEGTYYIKAQNSAGDISWVPLYENSYWVDALADYATA